LKLLLASVAVLTAWFWLRAELSRTMTAGESIRFGSLATRGAVLVAATIWFVVAVFGVLGGLVGWLILAAVVGIAAKFLVEGLRVGQAEQTVRDAEPPRENDL